MLTMRSDNDFAKWYLYLLATIYVFICGPWCVYYFYQDLIISGAYVSWVVQITCLIAAVSSALYFARPQIGHHGLFLATLLAIFYSVKSSNIAAISFHTVVLIILCIPVIIVLRGYSRYSD